MAVPLNLERGLPHSVNVPPSPLKGRQLIDARTSSLLKQFEATCFPYCTGQREDLMAYKDFAASAQHAFEAVILGLAAHLKESTGAETLVLAGGVALNCAANGRLASSGLFRNIYIQPAAHDASVAIGAALLAARSAGILPSGAERASAFLGPAETTHRCVLLSWTATASSPNSRQMSWSIR